MIGFNAMMQAITKNVVMPPMTSVLTVVEFSRSLNNRSRIAGASGVLAVRAARAAIQALLRHAHTEARRSGSRSMEARILPRAAGSIRVPAVGLTGAARFNVLEQADGEGPRPCWIRSPLHRCRGSRASGARGSRYRATLDMVPAKLERCVAHRARRTCRRCNARRHG